MRVFIEKALFLIMTVYGIIAGLNYYIDPASLYNTELIDSKVRFRNQISTK